MYREYLETLKLNQIKALIKLYSLHTKIIITKRSRSELIEDLIKHTNLKDNKIVLKKGLVAKKKEIDEFKPKPRAKRQAIPQPPALQQKPEEEVKEPEEESHTLEQIQGFLRTLNKDQIKRLSRKPVYTEEDKLMREEAQRLLKGSKIEEEPKEKKTINKKQPEEPKQQPAPQREKKSIINPNDKFFIFDTQGKYKKKIINLSYNNDQFIYKDVLVTNNPKTMEEESGSGWRLEYVYSLQSRHNLPFTNPINDTNYPNLMNDVEEFQYLKEDDEEDGNRHIIVAITDIIKDKKYHVGHITTKLNNYGYYEIDIDFVDVFPTYQGKGYSSYLFGLLFSYLKKEDILKKTKLIKLYYAANEKGAIKVYDRAMREAGFINNELKHIDWSNTDAQELGKIHVNMRRRDKALIWYNQHKTGNGRKIAKGRNNIKSNNRLAMEEENRRYRNEKKI